MRLVAHLSDFHFGRVDHRLLAPLAEAVWAARPHLVAVSGDLTQRAREREFREAAAYLDTLPAPRIVVPGNHDVPLYNLAARFLCPLSRYQRYITADLAPVYADDEMVVVGINTARSLTVKGGRVNRGQVERALQPLCAAGERVTKMVVTHHPFELPPQRLDGELVGRAQMAMRLLARCGADVFLAGHLHLGYTSHTAARYRIRGHAALVVQAGTAASMRGRGEFNSFNLLRIEHPRITVERHAWSPVDAAFLVSVVEEFEYGREGWRLV